MSCKNNDRALALYVEGDLEDSRALEAHLEDCPRCQGFLADLQESQGAVAELAGQPLPAEALVAVRRHVSARVAARQHSGRVPMLAWGSAALVLLALAGLVALAAWRSATPRVARQPLAVAQRVPALPGAPARPAQPERLAAPEPQAPPARRAVARPLPVPTEAIPGLSPEEADQLARAVVAVSRIRRLPTPQAPEEPGPTGTLVRLVTADPDVVIYWQMDPNGG